MAIEFKILDFLQSIRIPVLDSIMSFVTKLGNFGIVWIALAIVLICIPKTRKSGVILFAALAVDIILCNGILKNIFVRLRPCDINTTIQLLIPRPSGYSFPSGHTSSSFAAVTALFLAKEKKIWIPALVLAILIAFSRMYLYVHFPTDILGGIAVGILSGIIGKYLIEKYIKIKTLKFNNNKN